MRQSSVETPTEEQIGAFVLAAHGNLARVSELYQQNPALLNQSYQKFDETALQAAGHTGRREIAEFLLARGAPPTIFSAATLGDLAAVKEFLVADPSLATRPGVHGISLLFHAALSGNVELVEAILAAGAAPDPAALHAAIMDDRVDLVRWLLGRGNQDLGVTNFQGKTPLQVAEERQLTTIAALLRAAGATG